MKTYFKILASVELFSSIIPDIKMLPVLLVFTKHDSGQLTVFISVVLNVSCQHFLTTLKPAVEFNFLQQEMKSITHSPDPRDGKLLGLHSSWVVGSA